MAEDNLLSLSYGRIVRKDMSSNDGLLPESFETYQVVHPGDIVFRLTDLQNDKRSLRTALVQERGIITSAYVAVRPEGASPDYLNYLFRAYDLSKVFYSMGGGLRQSMKFADLKRLPILLPPLSEQSTISTFLDRETSKIEALVEEQKQLIELLKEKRQAIISHAVTKGLNPDAKMKDSGVEWLGEVPEHWETKRLKYAVSHVVDCLHTTPTYDGELVYPAVRTADLGRGRLLLNQARLVSEEIYQERIQRLKPVAGDILYSREGERFGMAALVPEGVDLCLGQRMMMFRTLSSVNPGYVMWALNSEPIYQQVLAGAAGATSPHANIGELINFVLPFPSNEEQQDIERYLDRETNRIDALIDEALLAVEFLQERRGALISAVITGKIDVRDARASHIQPERARAAVAAEVIERLAHKPAFGRVKLQKLAYLAEAHAGFSELQGNYLREAAGPLDRNMIAEMESRLQRQGHISVDQAGGPGGPVTYRVCGHKGAYRQEMATLLGDRLPKFNQLISDLGDLETKSVEAVATLYAVWNDALLDGHTPTDNTIVAGVLNEWHPEKAKKFKPTELHTWLGWMRRHKLVPEGKGPRTGTDRLFP